jgi:diaminopimelate decarboxylase
VLCYEAGDLLVFHDTGANSLALWSRHCSRIVPPVYSFSRTDAQPAGPAAKEAVRIVLQKAAEPVEKLVAFWS